MKIAYICDYCPPYDRKILTKEEAEEHEKTCCWNPQNKHCSTCRLFDTIKYRATDSLGRSFTNFKLGCTGNHISINSDMIFDCVFHEEK